MLKKKIYLYQIHGRKIGEGIQNENKTTLLRDVIYTPEWQNLKIKINHF